MDWSELKALADDESSSLSAGSEETRDWSRRWATRIGIGIALFFVLAHLLRG